MKNSPEGNRRRVAKYYSQNIGKVKDRLRELKETKKIYVAGYLTKHPCIDCGETDPIVLEFDHVRGIKKYNISNLVMQSYGLNTLIKEISKCEVRCANCHRRATHNRRINGRNQ